MSSYYTVRQFDSLTWRWYCEFLWNSRSDCEGSKFTHTWLTTKNPGVSLLQMTRVITTSTTTTTTTTTLQLWLELLMQPPALDRSYCQQHWSAMQHFYTADLKHFTQLQFQFQLEAELASVLLVPATHPSVKVYLQVQLKVSLLYGSPTVYKDLTINIFFSFTRHQTLDTRQQTLDTRQ